MLSHFGAAFVRISFSYQNTQKEELIVNIVIWSLVYHFFSIHSRHGLFGGYYF